MRAAVIGIDGPPGSLVISGTGDGAVKVIGFVNGPRRSGRWVATGDGTVTQRVVD